MKIISDCRNEKEKTELLEMERSNFRIEMANFADDCTFCMVPMDYKCNLTDKIKFNYRSNMQYGVVKFFDWTKYNQLIIENTKCSSISFCNKKDFVAYVIMVMLHQNELLQIILVNKLFMHMKQIEYNA